MQHSFALFLVSALGTSSVVLARHDSWSCVDESLFETCCVAVTWTNPNATAVTAWAPPGSLVVGITALGAANADGVPRLACVASAGAYPDIADVADGVGVIAVGPLTADVPSVTANRNQYCSQFDPDTIENFWGDKPTNKTIYGALDGETPQQTIDRLYAASQVALKSGAIPKGNLWTMGVSNPIVVAATLDSDWATTSCPRLGGPTCPVGETCPAGFETRGGTAEGNAFYLEQTNEDYSGAARLAAATAAALMGALTMTAWL